MAIHVSGMNHVSVELIAPDSERISEPIQWSDEFRTILYQADERSKSMLIVELNESVVGRYHVRLFQVPDDKEVFDSTIYADQEHDFKIIEQVLRRKFSNEIRDVYRERFETLLR